MTPLVKVVEHILIAIHIGVGAYQRQVVGLVHIGTVSLNRTVVKFGKLICVEEFRQISGFLEVILSAEVHAGTTLVVAALGLYKDHTVCGACAVNGGCSRVLQNRDALDIVGVQVAESHLAIGSVGAETRHSIYHKQRLLIATDANRSLFRRCRVTRNAHYAHAGNLSGKSLVDIHRRDADKLIARDYLDR